MPSQQWSASSKAYLTQQTVKLQECISNSLSGQSSDFKLPNIDPTQELLAFDQLIYTFELSSFESSLLLLCMAWELTPDIALQCQQFLDSEQPLGAPNLSLALALFGSDLEHICPRSPLLQWQLIHQDPRSRVLSGPLSVDRWVFYYLLGFDYPIPQYSGSLEPEYVDPSTTVLAQTYTDFLDNLLSLWSQLPKIPITQIVSNDPHAQQLIAAIALNQLNYHAYKIQASTLNFEPKQIHDWIVHWQRFAVLNEYALILDCGDPNTLSQNARSTILELLKKTPTPVILCSSERFSEKIEILSLELPKLTPQDQKDLWIHYLEDLAPSFNGQVGTIVSQFNLSANAIQTVSRQAIAQVKALTQDEQPDVKDITDVLWKFCRTQSRSSLEDLVQRIEPKTTWDELILPPDSVSILHQIIATVEQRAKVYDQWKMGGNTRRGMGITSLFYGPSGTGKTTAAEIIAHDLNLDLYRVDLSQVTSKYIGETEKNLAKVFDSAESSGAVLLFDEADSIIGKRSEVKDARDRYANQEVGYLLQRMEEYSGLAILTTNLPNSLDSAFMRRIRFSVRFEYPNVEQRALIWERSFPSTAPTQGLSWSRLAQLTVSGASIRNIAMGSAFLAAKEGDAILMKHVLAAARAECQKLGRSITDQEIRGWG
jgi:ATPase family associated with various cellular activities (AAA)